MKTETKLLRRMLYKEFPNNRFKISIIDSYSYNDMSEIIRIKTDASLEDVKKCLLRVTSGITVYSKGEKAAASDGKASIQDFTETMVNRIMIESMQQ